MNKKNKAFSLLEMVVVLFIIGLILGITVPTFGPMMRTSRLKGAVQNLADAMESARQYAKTIGKQCDIVFAAGIDTSLDNKSYKIVYQPVAGTYQTVDKVIMLPKGIEIDFSNSTLPSSLLTNVPYPEDDSSTYSLQHITFKPNGSSGTNGHISLYDKNTNSFQRIYFYNQPLAVEIRDINAL